MNVKSQRLQKPLFMTLLRTVVAAALAFLAARRVSPSFRSRLDEATHALVDKPKSPARAALGAAAGPVIAGSVALGKEAASQQVQQRVVKPAQRKATLWGIAAFAVLSLWIALVCVLILGVMQ